MKRVILFMLLFLTAAAGCGRSADIGIIGGADGPTSIVVGTRMETVVCTEMPALPGIPVPPGVFAEGWESTDGTVSIHLKMITVTESAFRSYTEETLPGAGYILLDPALVEGITEDRVDSVLCEGEEYSIQLLYAVSEETLTVMITEKS